MEVRGICSGSFPLCNFNEKFSAIPTPGRRGFGLFALVTSFAAWSLQTTRMVQLFPLHFYNKLGYSPVEVEGGMVLPERIELPQGTLDLIILRTLLTGAQHGWAISERVQQVSSDVLSIQQGSLYPALHRLERHGWIKAQWGTSENNRRAKYYELTPAGRRQLDAETEAWRKLTIAVEQVLEGA